MTLLFQKVFDISHVTLEPHKYSFIIARFGTNWQVTSKAACLLLAHLVHFVHDNNNGYNKRFSCCKRAMQHSVTVNVL